MAVAPAAKPTHASQDPIIAFSSQTAREVELIQRSRLQPPATASARWHDHRDGTLRLTCRTEGTGWRCLYEPPTGEMRSNTNLHTQFNPDCYYTRLVWRFRGRLRAESEAETLALLEVGRAG